jgi:hypothetical protein
MSAAVSTFCDRCHRRREVHPYDSELLCKECRAFDAFETGENILLDEPSVPSNVAKLAAHQRNGHAPPAAPREPLRFVSLGEFAAVEEPGAEPLVGTIADNLIPQGGDVLLYGDGGSSKTTLTVDLAMHLENGRDWLGYPVNQSARVLLIENEGPRAPFREKMRRKLTHWDKDREPTILERPWASFSFSSDEDRAELVKGIESLDIDVVIAGPVVTLGMDTAGTLQEVRAFMALIHDIRRRLDRPLTVLLVHHENKGGAVSGAWEGAGDTLLHATSPANGMTNIYIQKARWASESHHRTLKLEWADGDSFEVASEHQRDAIGEVAELLADGRPRIVDEVMEALELGKTSASEALKDERFQVITGQAAKALGRHVTAKLYTLATEPDYNPPVGLSRVSRVDPLVTVSEGTRLPDSPVRESSSPGRELVDGLNTPTDPQSGCRSPYNPNGDCS